VVVVAPRFPIAGLVFFGEADAGEPLGTLPKIEVRHERPYRGSMGQGKASPVKFPSNEAVRTECFVEPDVRRVTVCSLKNDVLGAALGTRSLGQFAQGDTSEFRPQNAPARDAMHVHAALYGSEFEELTKANLERALNCAMHAQAKLGELGVPRVASHRLELFEHSLPRGQPWASVDARGRVSLIREEITQRVHTPTQSDERCAADSLLEEKAPAGGNSRRFHADWAFLGSLFVWIRKRRGPSFRLCKDVFEASGKLWHFDHWMCRLFGFRSVIPSQVHRSLLAAENALGVQSNKHPDGWGVAYYVDGTPHVTRSPMTAIGDSLFRRLSGVVASETVLAHVRQATQGTNSVLNCHPFQYGRWVGAHNGDIPNFSETRAQLEAEVSPKLRRFVLGETDSELLFHLFLTRLETHGPLSRPASIEEITEALAETVRVARAVCDTRESRALLTLMVTDGKCLAVVHGGKDLYYSTYKRKCADRDTCRSLSPECEAPTQTGFVNHLIISSEELSGENVWAKLREGDVLAVDHRMRVFLGEASSADLNGRLRLPVLGPPGARGPLPEDTVVVAS
jgi:predicted glutamine amidotransferase